MEKITYRGKIIEVVEKEVDRKGRKIIFEIARRAPGTRIIIAKNDQILLTREYRHEIDGYDYRLPGGKVYDLLEDYNNALRDGVDIAEAAKAGAKKEAFEEAGIEANEITFFHKSICGATVVWDLFYYVVTDFKEAGQHLEEDEEIQVEWVHKDKVRKMCIDGTVSEERSALVLLRYIDGVK